MAPEHDPTLRDHGPEPPTLPQSPLVAAPLVGRSLGRYELTREIGRGGMGVVFEARDAQLGRRVAIKTLRSDASPRMIERLRREASLSAGLMHPGIVDIHEIGEAEGLHYVVMDYIDGEPLSQVAARVDLDRRIELLAQAAEAVGRAHGNAIVHRDLKPANIMVTDGVSRAIVVDFGLARDLAEEDTRLTDTGATLGTPAYMSPEQVRGDTDHIGPRTDVWALGAILYEMLAGRRAFDQPTPPAIFRAILAKVLSPPPGPRRLGDIALDALEKRPEKRYSDAGRFAAELRRWQRGERIEARRRRRWQFRVHPLAACAVLLALVALLLVLPPLLSSGEDFSELTQARAAAAAGDWPAVERLSLRGLRRGRNPRSVYKALRALLARARRMQTSSVSPDSRARAQALRTLQRDIERARAATYDARADAVASLRALERALLAFEKRWPHEGRPVRGRGWALVGDLDRAQSALESIENPSGAVRATLGSVYLRRMLVARWNSHGRPFVDTALVARWAGKARAQLDVESSGWDKVPQLDRDLAQAYLALAREERDEVRELVRSGAQQHKGQRGAERFDALLGWVTSDTAQKLVIWRRALDQRPHDAWLQLLCAHGCRGLRRKTNALHHASRAVEIAPRLSVAQHELGHVYAESGRFAEARKAYEAAIAIEPKASLFRHSLALLDEEQGDIAAAMVGYDAAIEIDRDSLVCYLYRGRLLLDDERPGALQRAAGDFAHVLKLDPKNANAHNNLGIVDQRRGDHRAAIARFDRAIALDPGLAQAFNNRAVSKKELRASTRDLDDALADFDRAIALMPHPRWLVNRAGTRALKGDHQGAVADCTAAIAKAPKMVVAWRMRGIARVQLGQVSEALQDLDRAVRMAPDDPEGYYQRAVARGSAGRFDGAREDLDRCLKIDPKRADALKIRALFRKHTGDPEGAISDYGRAIALTPGDVSLHLGRGRLRIAKRDWHGAMIDFDAALKLAPDHVDALLGRAWVAQNTNDPKRALALLLRARDRVPAKKRASVDTAIARLKKQLGQ